MEGYHKSVLLREVIDILNPCRNKWYLDATLGDGGHSIEILKLGGKVLGIDCDPQAIERSRKRFEGLGFKKDKYKLVKGNFRDIKNLIQTETNLARSDLAGFAGARSNLSGAIFDIGVSSLQLMSPERGFSFISDGPLDMRMDPDLGVKALDLVNNLSRKELYEIFKKYGEEKYSWVLAGALVLAREIKAFETTIELAECIEKTFRGKRRENHPATKVFQALRIVVNDELGALQAGLDQVKDLIAENGRIIIISFHSLEDRIVKLRLREWEKGNLGKVLTKKPVVPDFLETTENPRSRSAKMRVFKVTSRPDLIGARRILVSSFRDIVRVQPRTYHEKYYDNN